MKIKKGDKVQVITGAYKGTVAEVTKVFPKENKVIVKKKCQSMLAMLWLTIARLRKPAVLDLKSKKTKKAIKQRFASIKKPALKLSRGG